MMHRYVRIIRQSKVNEGIILCLTENYADSRTFFIEFYVSVIIVDIHLHLTKVFMGEFANLQVNKNVTSEQPVIENEIHIEMVSTKGESFLP